MTITARNYAAQAERDLMFYSKMSARRGFRRDAVAAQIMASMIRAAQHFAIPDGGGIFHDGLRGLRGMSPRLPYPLCTIEYFAPDDVGPANFIKVPKRLIIAGEIHRSVAENKALMSALDAYGLADHIRDVVDVVNFSGRGGNVVIQVLACFYVDGLWMPCSSGWITNEDWDDEKEGTLIDPPPEMALWRRENRRVQSDAPLFSGRLIVPMRDVFEYMVQQIGKDNAFQNAAHDIGGEVTAVLEFCEALGCSNIRAEPLEKIDQAKNARRIQDGKLPIYETKILTVDVPGVGSGGGGAGTGSHASPRQHLRRGHIRRLDDQRRIWVNSCVVGAAERGRVEKSYQVQPA